MKKRKSFFIKSVIVLVTLLIAAEVFLRVKYGLGKTILFRYDKDFEYIQQPQSVIRFGERSYYNAYSQRNRELSKQDSVYVDFFGDSILNGGSLLDQDSLATTELTAYWTKKFKKPILAINIAAGSWGPDNAFAYLKKYGNFNAKQIIMVVSSHDSYDDMTHENIVGTNPGYPDKQPFSALTEFITRYLPRYVPIFKPREVRDTDLLINKKTATTAFNTGFEDFYNYCKVNKKPLTIYLHADIEERKAEKYNEQGQEIIKFCEDHQIRLIRELDYHFPLDAYLDIIHLNPLGQEKMFEVFKQQIHLQ